MSLTCKVCARYMIPDHFGNTFDECSECVAERWLEEFVARRGAISALLPTVAIERAVYGATWDERV